MKLTKQQLTQLIKEELESRRPLTIEQLLHKLTELNNSIRDIQLRMRDLDNKIGVIKLPSTSDPSASKRMGQPSAAVGDLRLLLNQLHTTLASHSESMQ